MNLQITASSFFDAGHRMFPAPEVGYDRWHGHRYEVSVTAETTQWSDLPLDDFRRGLRELLGYYDHRVLTWKGDPAAGYFEGARIFDEQPTMETIARDVTQRAQEWLKGCGVRLVSLRVSSQPDAYVEVFP